MQPKSLCIDKERLETKQMNVSFIVYFTFTLSGTYIKPKDNMGDKYVEELQVYKKFHRALS